MMRSCRVTPRSGEAEKVLRRTAGPSAAWTLNSRVEAWLFNSRPANLSFFFCFLFLPRLPKICALAARPWLEYKKVGSSGPTSSFFSLTLSRAPVGRGTHPVHNKSTSSHWQSYPPRRMDRRGPYEAVMLDGDPHHRYFSAPSSSLRFLPAGISVLVRRKPSL